MSSLEDTNCLFHPAKLQTDTTEERIPQMREQVFFSSIPSHNINNAVKCGSAVKEFDFQRQLDNFTADLKHLSLTTELVSGCFPNRFLLTVKGEIRCGKYKAFQLIYDSVRCKACNYSLVVAFAKNKLKPCFMGKFFYELEREHRLKKKKRFVFPPPEWEVGKNENFWPVLSPNQ